MGADQVSAFENQGHFRSQGSEQALRRRRLNPIPLQRFPDERFSRYPRQQRKPQFVQLLEFPQQSEISRVALTKAETRVQDDAVSRNTRSYRLRRPFSKFLFH